jgi:hypothetical protein
VSIPAKLNEQNIIRAIRNVQQQFLVAAAAIVFLYLVYFLVNN